MLCEQLKAQSISSKSNHYVCKGLWLKRQSADHMFVSNCRGDISGAVEMPLFALVGF